LVGVTADAASGRVGALTCAFAPSAVLRPVASRRPMPNDPVEDR
jgi:hypothetical protein